MLIYFSLIYVREKLWIAYRKRKNCSQLINLGSCVTKFIKLAELVCVSTALGSCYLLQL